MESASSLVSRSLDRDVARRRPLDFRSHRFSSVAILLASIYAPNPPPPSARSRLVPTTVHTAA